MALINRALLDSYPYMIDLVLVPRLYSLVNRCKGLEEFIKETDHKPIFNTILIMFEAQNYPEAGHQKRDYIIQRISDMEMLRYKCVCEQSNEIWNPLEGPYLNFIENRQQVRIEHVNEPYIDSEALTTWLKILDLIDYEF